MPVDRSPPNISEGDVVLFSFLVLGVFFALLLAAILSYRLQSQKRALSPYTGRPMWRGEYIPLSSVEKIMKFLYYQNRSYDNRVFPMKQALVCRDTGRIFPYTISWWGFHQLDWTFLNKRYPGIYVSWGSLTSEQQQEIKSAHKSLKGFQTEKSCPDPVPRKITPEYSFLKPGPLYVDLHTKVLIGWKCVPDTLFEVLIVQKPKPLESGPKDRFISKRKKNDD